MSKSLLKTRARIGKISYINCLPFYHELDRGAEGEFEFIESVPSQINKAFAAGEIDIAPISSLEYLNHQDQYLLLKDLGIGSADFAGSVLLLSHKRLEELHGKTIAVTNQSLSSAVLLEILLKFKQKFKNTFSVCQSNATEMLRDHDAALIIGDDALFHKSDTFYYKSDLGEMWRSWTDLPFCYAVWAVRRDFAESYGSEVEAFQKRLIETRERNLMDIEKLVRGALGLDFWDQRFPKIFGYLFNLQYNVGPEMVKGLELYYRLAARLKVSPKAKPFEYFE